MRIPAILGAILVLTAPASAQVIEGDRDFVRQVNTAIDRGVQYLMQQEGGQGNWERFGIVQLAGMDGGATSLVTLALLNSGVRPEEQVIQRALKYLRRLPPQKTYVVALQTLTLVEARQKQDIPQIARNVQWLLDSARKSNGRIKGWSYPFSDVGDEVDASNTQYALLGLYAGKQAGVKIDQETWRQIRDLYLRDGEDESRTVSFWRYKPKVPVPGNGPSFSMTTAGVCGLVIARMGLTDSEQALDAATGVAANCGKYLSDQKIENGLNFLARHFAFEGTPEEKVLYYNIYGIERLGRLSGQRFIGRYDWYRAGCKWLLAENRQNKDGAWSDGREGGKGIRDTAFALLFLSKGRSPVLISKLAYGQHTLSANGIMQENLEPGGVIGWNRKHNDARHLVEFASREMFDGLPLAWQVYDPRRGDYSTPEKLTREVGTLVESPILYFNGHKAPMLSGQQKELLKQYVEQGGFILAEACCGSPEFARGFAELMNELFPENDLKPVGPDHAVWSAFFKVSPADFKGVLGLDRGCRTVCILSTEPLAGYWEESRFMPAAAKTAENRGEKAYKLAGNIIAYATGMEPPRQRGSSRTLLDEQRVDKSPPKGAIKPVQLRIPGEPPPAPAAMRTLVGHVSQIARLDVVLDKDQYAPLAANDPELFKHKFLYLHGRKAFTFDEKSVQTVRLALETGGLLLADACCGKKEFDDSFRQFAAKLFPQQKLERIPLDDLLYSDKLAGDAIASVKRREKVGGEGADGGFQNLPPALEGIKIDGRWVVIYSKFDLGCAIEGHRSTDCLGHDRDSALRLATAALLYSLKR